MSSMLLALIGALVLALLVTLNATPVSLQIGQTSLVNIPLFFVVVVAIFVGVFVASIATVINIIKSKITISGQKSELKKTYTTVGELKGRVSELEGENQILRDQIQELAPVKKASRA